MKVWVCVKVVDDGLEPIVETSVALTELEACKALAELEGFVIGPGMGYSSDPFEFAKELSQDDRTFYVKEHVLQAVPMTEQEKCVVPGTMRINDRPLSDFIAQL